MTTTSRSHHPQYTHRARVAGMSLVELLIGLVLSVVVLGMILQIFANGRQQFQTQEQLARIHENARQAFEMLNDDLHMAGFMGPMQQYWAVRETESAGNQRKLSAVTGECFTTATEQFRWVAPMITIPRAAPAFDRIPPKLFGRNNTNSRFTGCIPNGQYVAATDVLSVHYAGAPWSNAGTITTGKVPSNLIGNNDEMFYLRSNMEGGVAFTCGMGMGGSPMGAPGTACLQTAFSGASAMDPTFLALKDKLYGSPANPDPSDDVATYGIQAVAYYVRPCTNAGADGLCGNGDDNVPALVRARMEYDTSLCTGNDPCVVHEPVAEGVVSFQVQYGIDSPGIGTPLAGCSYDGYVDRYVTADQIGGGDISTDAAMEAWGHVLTVRIWLLLRSTQIESGYIDPNSPYDLGGVQVNAVNGYRHQLFTTTVTLRNFSPQTC